VDYSRAFVLRHGLGVEREFGVRDRPAWVVTVFEYRIGALVVAIAVPGMMLLVWR